MSLTLIDPEAIPGTDIDCDSIEVAGTQLRASASGIESASARVQESWRPLSAVFSAPEGPALLAAIIPADTDATTYAALLTGFGDAAHTLASTVRPHVEALKVVRADAWDFVDRVAGGVVVWPWESGHPVLADGPVAAAWQGKLGPTTIPWQNHGPSVDANTDMLERVNAAVAAILTAGAEFQNSVRKHIDLCFAPVGPVTAAQLNAMPGLPWGEAGPKATTCNEGFWSGMGNAAGETLSGVWIMTGGWLHDPDAAGAAWTATGEALGALGIGLVRMPGLMVVSAQGWDGAEKTLDPAYYSWLQETDEWTVSRLNAVADGFVGSEEDWNTNPAQATGNVVFNIATLLLPVKGGSALLKSGAVGSAAERLGLSSRVLESLTTPIKSAAGALGSGSAKVGDALRDLATTVRQSTGGSLNNLLTRTQAAVDDLAARLGGGQPAFAGIGGLDGFTHRMDTPSPVDVAHARMDSVAPVIDSPRMELDLDGQGGRLGSEAPSPWQPASVADIIGDQPVLRDGSHLRADGTLQPNAWYQTGEHEYFYHTDANGHIDRWITDDLQLKGHEGRLPHDPNTPGKLPGDHAGHLAGDRFGGSPKLDNLVSQLSRLNLSEYRRLENEWAGALMSNPPVKVTVDVNVVTDAATGRPTKFVIRSLIGSKPVDLTLRN
ncbi:DNA/RNA non-specific endonuclease [Microbacterium sp. M3]|uniref:DNA/RNA non-specific endonuclease n=1 Tax=Microbacterium arthrosphaerae TaxID=792652 RepID=A0ABU4H1N8_9MICO|nr:MULTISPECIES: DNA/RNA non-specific endonuclease [Microbacterium]MDW4572600.1 DNA/RNA non-specific endonuclease [Microbacterium arthrosphaerae]MDW7606455.1 DNA/RNA non-specific endonuclease [Microbacterium sp. M3]